MMRTIEYQPGQRKCTISTPILPSPILVELTVGVSTPEGETREKTLDITPGYRLQLFRTIEMSRTKDTTTEKQGLFKLMILSDSCKAVLHETAVPKITAFCNLKMDPPFLKMEHITPQLCMEPLWKAKALKGGHKGQQIHDAFGDGDWCGTLPAIHGTLNMNCLND
jgi:hypothetical protein